LSLTLTEASQLVTWSTRHLVDSSPGQLVTSKSKQTHESRTAVAVITLLPLVRDRDHNYIFFK